MTPDLDRQLACDRELKRPEDLVGGGLAVHSAKAEHDSAGGAPRTLRFRLRNGAIPFALCAAAFVAMAWATWQTWSEPHSDFGRELYVPWRLAEGEVLYRDLLYFNGPLSPYVNAGLMAVFSPAWNSIIYANLLVHAIVLVLLWKVVRQVADGIGATAAVLAVIFTVSFGSLMPGGNLNHIAPYSHEMTHGLLLAIAGLLAMQRFLARGAERGGTVDCAIGGACLGLLLLTKIELFLAGLAAQGVMLAIGIGKSKGRTWALVAFASGICAPATAAVLLLSTQMPITSALWQTLGSFIYTATTDVSAHPFYRWVMGLDRPAQNLMQSAKYAGFVLAIAGMLVGLAAFWARLGRRFGRLDALTEACSRRVLIGCCAAAIAAGFVLYLAVPWRVWTRLPNALNVFAALLAAGLALQFLGCRREVADARSAGAKLGFAVLALAMLAKVVLRPSLQHVGFALALPALALTSVAAVTWLPVWVNRRGWPGWIVRGGMLGFLAVLVLAHLEVTFRHNRSKTARLDVSGATICVSESSAGYMRLLQGEIDSLPAGATLAVLPEGALLNFTTGRRNPTGVVVAMPAEIAMFGEAEVIDRFARNPPTVIIVSEATLQPHGVRTLGDYAPNLAAWIAQRYTSSTPLDPTSHAVRVWHRD